MFRIATKCLLAAALVGTTLSVTPALANSPEDRFRQSDSDASGTLDRKEFRAFINRMAKDGQPLAKRVRFFRVYGMAFRLTDADKNGLITGAELIASEKKNRGR